MRGEQAQRQGEIEAGNERERRRDETQRERRGSPGAQRAPRRRRRAPRQRIRGANSLLDDNLLQVVSLSVKHEREGVARRGIDPRRGRSARRSRRRVGGVGVSSPGVGSGGERLRRLRRRRLGVAHAVGELAETRGDGSHAAHLEPVASAVHERTKRGAHARGIVREHPPRDVREALVDDGVVLIRAQTETLEGAERAEDEHEVRGQTEGIILRQGFELIRQFRHARVALLVELIDFLRRRAARAVERLERLGEHGDDDGAVGGIVRELRRNETEVDEVAEGLVVVSGAEVRDVLDERDALVLADGGHHPVVEDAQPTVLHQHEVARVGIRVEETSLQKLHHVAVEQRLHQLGAERARGGIVRDLRQLSSHHPLLRQHASAGEAAEHVRHLHRAPHNLHRRHVAFEPRRVVRLQAVIQFLQEPLRGDVQHRDESLRALPDLLQRLRSVGGERSRRLEQRSNHQQIQRHRLQDTRALHLHRHLSAPRLEFALRLSEPAGFELRAVHLPDGRRRHRTIKRARVLEDVLQLPPTQLLPNQRARLARFERRHLVQERLKLLEVRGG